MNRHVDDLVLCTINTSDFYNLHIELVKVNATLDRWIRHVKLSALPRYRREQNEPYFGLYLSEIEEVAKELQEYYEQSVKEGA